jgi:hypothetical protein
MIYILCNYSKVLWVLLVDAFVASEGIPTRGHGIGHMGLFVGTRLLFCFGENALGMKLGIHGLGDGRCGLVLGCHTHK